MKMNLKIALNLILIQFCKLEIIWLNAIALMEYFLVSRDLFTTEESLLSWLLWFNCSSNYREKIEENLEAWTTMLWINNDQSKQKISFNPLLDFHFTRLR